MNSQDLILKNNKGKPVCKLVKTELTSTNEENFIGIFLDGNLPTINYPSFLDIDEENLDLKETKKKIKRLLYSLILASKKSDKNQNEGDINSDVKGEFPLSSYLWIIKDYLNNGFYKNRERVYKINTNGRINFKRTLKQTPLISNGNIVFNNIVYENKSNIDNILVEIHHYCVKRSINLIGWYFDLEDFVQYNKDFRLLRDYYIKTLRKEINNTFEDVKKLRLIHMLNIVKAEDKTSKNNNFLFGVTSFAPVFEKMIDKMLSNISDKIKLEYYPSGVYKTKDNSITVSSVQPDTIYDGESLYIIDSKYYKVGNLPQMESITKQIIYGRYNALKHNKNIYNVFILPTKDKLESNHHFKYFGVGSYDSINLENLDNYEKIHTIYIDFNFLFNNYDRTSEKERDLLIKEIEELIKEKSI